MSKSNGLKIVMVGGGSFNWTPWLMSDLLHEDELDGCQVVLLDPDQKSARTVEEIVRFFAQAQFVGEERHKRRIEEIEGFERASGM